MAVVQALKKTQKGQLSYDRYFVPNKFDNDLEKYSSPPLSGPHKEREFSLLNVSFGLDQTSFSNNNDSISPSKVNLNLSRSSLNHSKNSATISRDDLDNSKNGHEIIRDRNVNNNLRNIVNISDINNSNDKTADQLVKTSGNAENKLTTSQILADLDLEIDLNEGDGIDTSDKETFLVSPVSSASEKHEKGITSPGPCPMYTQYGLTSCAILDEEKIWDSVTKEAIRTRRVEFKSHEEAINSFMKQKESDLTKRIKHMIIHREQLIEQSKQESKARVQQRLQKQKEGDEEHQKKIVTKHQEIERQREKLLEEEKKRHQLELAKLNQLRSVFKEFEDNRSTFATLREGFELKDKLPQIVGQCLTDFDKAHAALGQLLADCEKTLSVPSEIINKFIEQKALSLKKIEVLKIQIDAIQKESKDKELKDAEQKKIELEKKEEAKKVAEKALDCSIQTMAYVLKEKQAKEKILADSSPVVQSFTANVSMKKYRFDLQRAVNTPINAISAVSGSHLRDKLKILHSLLSGQNVQVTGKQVCAGQSPEGMAFCQNLIAKMLVKKAEEQVTSNHESAFAIAAVTVGLWGDFPVVGDLFMGHLQAVCPYILPFYNLKFEGQSTQDYYRSMGYKVGEDGSVEEQDKFLHRMSGVMRLYSACLVSKPLKGAHPHGLEHAWTWLCRTLNMEPKADVTAAMIFDLLSVTGHALFAEYKIQFVKLLHLIYKTYLPKLKSVSITNSTVGRLEIFLEKSLKNSAKVEPPKGLLPPNFWYS